jgi:antitoxin (DNA-binding transcriptional repressor) of toxin-antitoxin stability system
MATVDVGDLSRNTGAVLDDVITTGHPAVIVLNGAPVAAIVAIDANALETFVLANSSDYVLSMVAVDREIAAGTFAGHPLAEVEAEMAAMAAEAEQRGAPYADVLAERDAAEASAS